MTAENFDINLLRAQRRQISSLAASALAGWIESQACLLEDIQSRLAEHRSPVVRSALASHESVLPAIQMRLVVDEAGRVRQALAKNAQATEQALNALLDGREGSGHKSWQGTADNWVLINIIRRPGLARVHVEKILSFEYLSDDTLAVMCEQDLLSEEDINQWYDPVFKPSRSEVFASSSNFPVSDLERVLKEEPKYVKEKVLQKCRISAEQQIELFSRGDLLISRALVRRPNLTLEVFEAGLLVEGLEAGDVIELFKNFKEHAEHYALERLEENPGLASVGNFSEDSQQEIFLGDYALEVKVKLLRNPRLCASIRQEVLKDGGALELENLAANSVLTIEEMIAISKSDSELVKHILLSNPNVKLDDEMSLKFLIRYHQLHTYQSLEQIRVIFGVSKEMWEAVESTWEGSLKELIKAEELL